MYGSPPAKDLNRPFHHHHQQQMSSGLLRYRSAPSSLFGEACEDFLPVRPSSPDTDAMFARFLPPDLREEIRDKPTPPPGSGGQRNPQFPPPQLPMAAAVSAAEENAAAATAAFSSAAATQMLYQQQIASSLATSIAMEADQMKNGSNLIRHSSSPAGLFTHFNVDNGYGVMRGIGGFRNGNEGGGGGTRLKSQLSFSSRQSSSAAGMMSQVSEEMDNEESMGGYPIASWEESPLLSENNFPAAAAAAGGGLKRARENQSEIQNGEVRNGLCHQFSLPKTSSEMSALEKFLQFQDSVPCKIRAKRGCATHPRSIAERVRRTRISERMRKLQDLVPNMDKQTNTADMLDLAVHYIKDLQKQVETLNEGRASCTCSSSKQKPYQSSTS